MAIPVVESVGAPWDDFNDVHAVPAPAGLQTDDIVIVVIESDDGETITGVPTGFSLRVTFNIGTRRMYVYWKRIVTPGSEPATYNFTWSDDEYSNATAIRVSGCITTGDPFNIHTTATLATNNTTLPTVSTTTTVDDTLLLYAAGWYELVANFVNLSGFTNLNTGQSYLQMAVRDHPTAGATGNVSMTTSANTIDKRVFLGALIGESSGDDIDVDGDLEVEATIDGTLITEVFVDFEGNRTITATIDGTLLSVGDVDLSGNLPVTASITGTLSISGEVDFGGDLDVDVDIDGSLTVNEIIEIDGDLGVTATIDGSLDITQTFDLEGNLGVTATITGSLLISQDEEISGDRPITATITGSLSIIRDLDLAGDRPIFALITGRVRVRPPSVYTICRCCKRRNTPPFGYTRC